MAEETPCRHTRRRRPLAPADRQAGEAGIVEIDRLDDGLAAPSRPRAAASKCEERKRQEPVAVAGRRLGEQHDRLALAIRRAISALTAGMARRRPRSTKMTPLQAREARRRAPARRLPFWRETSSARSTPEPECRATTHGWRRSGSAPAAGSPWTSTSTPSAAQASRWNRPGSSARRQPPPERRRRSGASAMEQPAASSRGQAARRRQRPPPLCGEGDRASARWRGSADRPPRPSCCKRGREVDCSETPSPRFARFPPPLCGGGCARRSRQIRSRQVRHAKSLRMTSALADCPSLRR